MTSFNYAYFKSTTIMVAYRIHMISLVKKTRTSEHCNKIIHSTLQIVIYYIAFIEIINWQLKIPFYWCFQNSSRLP